MLHRTYLGLEIHQHGLRAVAAQRRGKNIAVLAGQTSTWEEKVLQSGFMDPNIAHPELFIAAVKAVLDPLAKRDNRIAVALPDNSGRLFLLDLETPFKNRNEGAEIIRWHLKDQLPVPSNQVALDFQVLEEKESGQKRILAAVITRKVLAQYEELLAQAGYVASIVDFHFMALYNAYSSKIDLGRDFILIGLDGSQLGIMVCTNQILDYHRTRQVGLDPQQVFQELNRSLGNYRHEQPAINRIPAYLHSDWSQKDDLFTAVNSVFDQEVQQLSSPVNKLVNGEPLTEAIALTAAFGVVERIVLGGA